jgi:hypothetical protein
VISLIFGALIIFLLWKGRFDFLKGVCLCILIPFIISPYAWAYDQVFLIVPILYLIGEGVRRNWPFMVTSIIFLAASIISLISLLVAAGSGHDEFSVILPLILLACIALIILYPLNNQEYQEGITTSPAI